MRRTIVAFALGAALFGAPLVAAQTITGDLDLELAGGNSADANPGDVTIHGGYWTLDSQGQGGSVSVHGGFNNGGGGAAEVFVSGPDGAAGGFLSLQGGNSSTYGGSILLTPGTGNPRGLVIVNNLPTSDPHVQGALYVTSNGTLKVSQG